MKPIIVTAAILQREDGKYLITQRPKGKHLEEMWEFPGGTKEPGESLEECLRREIKEELGIEIRVIREFEKSTAIYEGGPVIDLRTYYCEHLSGELQPLEVQAMRWVDPYEMASFEMPKADIPIARKLKEMAENENTNTR